MSGIVSPTEIEKQLKLTLERQSGKGVIGTRASLFNLVIFKRAFVPGPSDSALDFLLGKRPARIVHIDSGYPDKTRVSVFARCYPDRKDRTVCFEEVLISNGSDGKGMDPGMWSPILIHDLPTYLWWLNELESVPRDFINALEYGDKVLIYSSFNERAYNENPLIIFKGMAKLLREERQLPVLMDFSWVRLFSLRKFIAKLFDERVEDLYKIREIRVNNLQRSESLLLFLWFASRLGWRNGWFREDSVFFTDKNGKEVTLKHSGVRSLEDGVKMEFSFRNSYNLSVECDTSGCMEALSEGRSGVINRETHIERVRFEMPSVGEILLKEVDSLVGDDAYYEVLKMAEGVRL